VLKRGGGGKKGREKKEKEGESDKGMVDRELERKR